MEQFRIGLTIAAILAGCASPGLAATVCVDPDDGACHATIQDGVDAAAAGDTVDIAKGTYFEAVVIPAGKDGITLTGKAVIDAHEAEDPNHPDGSPSIIVNSNDVSVEKITIYNGSPAVAGHASAVSIRSCRALTSKRAAAITFCNVGPGSSGIGGRPSSPRRASCR